MRGYYSNRNMKMWKCKDVPFSQLVKMQNDTMEYELVAYGMNRAPEAKLPPEPPASTPDINKGKHPWKNYEIGTMAKWKWTAGTNKGKTMVMTVIANSGSELILTDELFDKTGVFLSKNETKINFKTDKTAMDAIRSWKFLGKERVTVPAGEFECDIRGEEHGSKIWTSRKVPFYNVVKKVGSGPNPSIFELVKVRFSPPKHAVIVAKEPKRADWRDGEDIPIPEQHPWANVKPGDMVQYRIKIKMPTTDMESGMRWTIKSNDGKEVIYKMETMDKNGKITYTKEDMKMPLIIDEKYKEKMSEWKITGREMIITPSGNLFCKVMEGPTGKIWMSKQVPCRMVKMVAKYGKIETVMELVKYEMK